MTRIGVGRSLVKVFFKVELRMFPTGRKAWLLISLLALSAILAAVQNRFYTAGRPSALQAPAIFVLRPFSGCLAVMNGIWNNLAAEATQKASLESDKQKLQRQVTLLSVQKSHLMRVAYENVRLRQLLKMTQHDPSGHQWIPSDVVERHPSQWFQYITLDRGSNAGVKKHSVVITPQGLVGQAVMVRSDSCDVLLLTDPASNAGAIVPRTHDVGYIQGTGQNELTLNFFDKDHGVKVGDTVVSSPFSAVYPSGMIIGKITAVSGDTGTSTRRATVRPAVQFDSLEETLVIP